MSAPPPVSRRRLLGVAAAGLIVGGGVAETANLLAPGTTASASTVAPPAETLMYEHGVLKRVLLVYQAALTHTDTDPSLAAAGIQGGAGVIHDFIEDFHEALEEGYVFPALRAAGQLVPTVDTLLVQHARGRLITQYLLAAATAAALPEPAVKAKVTSCVTAFVRMYEPHEAREDTVVFPAFQALVGAGGLERLGETFARLQVQQLGADAFAATLARVDGLETALGIDQLDAFTPAAVAPATS